MSADTVGYRERYAVSVVNSDAADAHILAGMVRAGRHQLCPVSGDWDLADAVKVLSCAHKTLIWGRARHAQLSRRALPDYLPAALDAFENLDVPDALKPLIKAPDPATAARLSPPQIAAAVKHAGCRDVDTKVGRIQFVLRAPQLGQLLAVTTA